MASLRRRLLPVALLCVLPGAASAQTWQDAVKKGDYRAAVELLQPLAIASMYDLTETARPEPVRQLAMMYARGLGVPADARAACGLGMIASRSIRLRPGPSIDAHDFAAYQARVKEGEDFIHQLCDALSEYDRDIANRIMCFTFGMPDEVLTLGSEAIRVDRAGIRLASDEGHRFEAPVNCPSVIARVRALTIEPPADAVRGVKARYFIDVLVWGAGQSSDDAKALRYGLSWQLFELSGKKFELVTMQDFAFSDTWPSPALPPDFDTRFAIEMIRTGHIHWKMDGAPPKRGWVMRPEQEK